MHDKSRILIRNPHSNFPPFTFAITFSAKSKLVARKQGRCAEKASAGKEFPPEIQSCFRRRRRAYRALPNSEFGMWNSEFFVFLPFRIPHSAFRI
jgi:uncharacterized protein YktB (UPF0637 family)